MSWLTHSTWHFQSWCQIKTVERTQLNKCKFTYFFRSDSICRCMDWISRICVVTIFFAFFKYQYCSISPFSRQKLGTNGITAVIDCQFFWRPKMNERFYTYNYVPTTYQLPVDASYIYRYAFTGKICQCHSIPNSRNVRYCLIHSEAKMRKHSKYLHI